MGTKTTSKPSPGAYGNQSSNAGTFSDNNNQGFPENGFIDKIWVYTGANSGTANFVFGLYRTDTNVLVAQTTQASHGAKGWNSCTFGLNSSNNNYGGQNSPHAGSSYNSPYLYLWTNYGWAASSWASAAQNIGINNGVGSFYYVAGSGIASGRLNGSVNPFGNAGQIYYYLEYFPEAKFTSVTSTPVAIGQTFDFQGVSLSSGITSVDVNGTNAPTYTVNSDTDMTITVPVGATTGPVHVYTNAGLVTSTTNLTVSSIRVWRGSPGAWTFSSQVNRWKAGSPGSWSSATQEAARRGTGWTTGQ